MNIKKKKPGDIDQLATPLTTPR